MTFVSQGPPAQLGACAVTGASGYVGGIVAAELRKHMPVVALVRNPKSESDVRWSFESDEDLAETLRERGVKTLVHAAWDMRASTKAEMEKSCVQGSANLFAAAREAGVERIVFISTISAFPGCRSAYGQTKLEVEKLAQQAPAAVVIRPGLVFGETPGGVFGGLKKQTANSKALPMIGSGEAPQYLLHEQTLADTLRRAVLGEFDSTQGAPITLAHPRPWPFRDLVKSIAASQGREVKLVPMPWPLLYAGIRTGEMLGVKLPFRSDSIISFVHYDRDPDFSALEALNIPPIPYNPA